MGQVGTRSDGSEGTGSMHWRQVEDYFRNLIGRARTSPEGAIDGELASIRFATMCVFLGLDPDEGRNRVLSSAERELDGRAG